METRRTPENNPKGSAHLLYLRSPIDRRAPRRPPRSRPKGEHRRRFHHRKMDAGAPATTGRGRGKRKAAKESAAAADKKRRAARNTRQPTAPPSIDLNTTHPALNNFDATTIAGILSSSNADQVRGIKISIALSFYP